MNISVKGDYALKAIFDLAFQGAARPVKIADIAARQKIPQKFLELILAQLKQGGFVQSRRGAEGGYLLARGPEAILVGDMNDPTSRVSRLIHQEAVTVRRQGCRGAQEARVELEGVGGHDGHIQAFRRRSAGHEGSCRDQRWMRWRVPLALTVTVSWVGPDHGGRARSGDAQPTPDRSLRRRAMSSQLIPAQSQHDQQRLEDDGPGHLAGAHLAVLEDDGHLHDSCAGT